MEEILTLEALKGQQMTQMSLRRMVQSYWYPTKLSRRVARRHRELTNGGVVRVSTTYYSLWHNSRFELEHYPLCTADNEN